MTLLINTLPHAATENEQQRHEILASLLYTLVCIASLQESTVLMTCE